MGTPTAPLRHRVSTEALTYAVTALIVIVLGALFKSLVLNWIVGPGLVVVLVIALTPLIERVRRSS